MKRNILIVFTGAMNPGGIEKSLIGLLNIIDYKKYNVDLFLYGHHGEWITKINKNVNILPEVKELAFLRESFFTKIKNKCFYSAYMRLSDAVKSKFIKIDHDKTWKKIMIKKAPQLSQKYDIAINFFLPFDYIFEKADAKLRVGWIHTDYSSVKWTKEKLMDEYSRLDKIAAVSKKCADAFLEICPELSDKIIILENILPREIIIEESNLNCENEIAKDNAFTLLSIGRFSHAKNFDNIPEITSKLLDMGLNIRWYIIGYGSDKNLIESKISEFNMQDHVVLLGKKANPYPFIKACDLYVQPSRYEGKCVAVREAQILGKCVVITDYPTSNDQLQDGFDGIIVPINNKECAEGIADIIFNNDLRNKIANNTKTVDYTNSIEINKLYELIQ